MLFFPTEKFLDDFDYFTQIFSKNGYRKILKPETVNTVQDAMSNRLYFIYKGIIKIVILTLPTFGRHGETLNNYCFH